VQEQLKRLSTERASMSEQQAAKTRKLMQDFGTMLQVCVRHACGGMPVPWRQQISCAGS
jgi:hypothetical protein